MIKAVHSLALAALAALLAVAPAHAEETEVTVRVLSRDAKFIGSSMGGVHITLTDGETGKVLAQGLTEGGTGDTALLMQQSHERGQNLSTEGAAAFNTTLDIDRPVHLEVTATGPLAEGKRQGANTVSASQWVIPGKHLSGGDGWVLEMPGFVVTASAPAQISLEEGGDTVTLGAHVTMMCGCPITPGGLWDADKYEVVAMVTRDGADFARVPLSFAGEVSTFAGEFDVSGTGVYEAVIYAHDAANGNTGLDRARVVVSE